MLTILKIGAALFFGLMVGEAISAIKAVPGDLTSTVIAAGSGTAFIALILGIYAPSK